MNVIFGAQGLALLFLGSVVAATLPDDWDAVVEQGMKDWNLPGASMAIVKDGEAVLIKGYGVREVGKNEPVDDETLFAIGSTTKAFSSAAIGMLVDQGKVDWDSYVHDIAPEVAFSDPWVTKEIRVSDCFANHSGLSPLSEMLWYGTDFNRDEILKRLVFVPIDEGFRYRFQYRNVMFLLGGELIPRITGITWDDYITRSLIQPLNMTRTFATEAGIDAMENVARPHVINYSGDATPVPYRNMHNIAPAGSIVSCARDLVSWLKLNLNMGSFDGHPLMKPETVAFLHSSRTPVSTVGPGGEPLSPPAELRAYALGWITESYKGTRLVWHNGGIDGMSAWVGLAPELGLGFAMVSNLENCDLRKALFYRLVDHAVGREPTDLNPQLVTNYREALAARDAAEKEWQKLAHSNGDLPLPIDTYVGDYESPILGMVRVVVEGDRLVVMRTAEQALDLAWKEDNTFIGRFRNVANDLRDGKSEYVFDVKDGEITGMTENGLLEFEKVSPPK